MPDPGSTRTRRNVHAMASGLILELLVFGAGQSIDLHQDILASREEILGVIQLTKKNFETAGGPGYGDPGIQKPPAATIGSTRDLDAAFWNCCIKNKWSRDRYLFDSMVLNIYQFYSQIVYRTLIFVIMPISGGYGPWNKSFPVLSKLSLIVSFMGAVSARKTIIMMCTGLFLCDNIHFAVTSTKIKIFS